MLAVGCAIIAVDPGVFPGAGDDDGGAGPTFLFEEMSANGVPLLLIYLNNTFCFFEGDYRTRECSLFRFPEKTSPVFQNANEPERETQTWV